MPREVNPAFIRSHHVMRIPLTGVLDQAGAVTFLDSLVIPYRCALERVTFIPDVAGAGAGASQVFKVRKGAAASTTVLATLTLTLATHVMGGAGIVATVAAADDQAATFKDGDLLSITKDAGGTVFSGGGGTLQLTFRQRPQNRI